MFLAIILSIVYVVSKICMSNQFSYIIDDEVPIPILHII